MYIIKTLNVSVLVNVKTDNSIHFILFNSLVSISTLQNEWKCEISISIEIGVRLIKITHIHE